MERLTEQAQHLIKPHLSSGDLAIDATAGNGHDTVFLSQSVGPTGKVFAFDLQSRAIEKSRKRLEAANCENVVFFQQCHAEIEQFVPEEHHGSIAAIMFNLGYLPGFDRSFITQTPSTKLAIESSLRMLRNKGILTVLAYTGHPGGLEEAIMAEMLLQSLSRKEFTVKSIASPQVHSPRLFVVTRQKNSL